MCKYTQVGCELVNMGLAATENLGSKYLKSIEYDTSFSNIKHLVQYSAMNDCLNKSIDQWYTWVQVLGSETCAL